MINPLKQPFNIITLTLTVISIGLSIFIYQNSKKARDISYQITQPVVKIFDSRNATPKIKLLENDSVLIADNVYLLTGKIWNSGNLAILPSDVRRELTIELDMSNRILDYKIINEKESGISNFRLDLISKNKLSLNWDYFDPSYGLVFQIMFLGISDNPNFQLNGKILEISEFKEIDFIEDKGTFTKWYNIIFLSIMIFFFVFMLVTRREKKKDFMYWYLLIFSLAMLVMLIYHISKYFVFIDKIPI